jgi:hypothetical protein
MFSLVFDKKHVYDDDSKGVSATDWLLLLLLSRFVQYNTIAKC